MTNFKTFVFGAFMAAMAGCGGDLMTTTTNGQEFETVAAKNSFLFTSADAVVAQPSRTVKARLSQFASECINGVGSITTISSGSGAIFQQGSVTRTYNASITTQDRVDRLVITLRPQGSAPTVVVSTKIIAQADATTRLSTVHGKTFDLFHRAAVKWANGSQTGCPQFK